MIVGEAGIGKSRIVHEFLTGKDLEEFRVLKAEASPFEVNTTYYPIKGMIYSWLNTEAGNKKVGAQLESALQELNPALLSLLPVLSALLGEPVTDPQWIKFLKMESYHIRLMIL